ncbi:MAG: two-component regulator propeller domain-containing protein [Bacteroidota bacterium]
MKDTLCSLFSLLLFCHYTQSPAADYTFVHLGESEGLANSNPQSVIQDQSGDVWIGTQDGLFRYDGHRMQAYYNDPADSNSISGNDIRKLFIDSRQQIWIGTGLNGLNRYDPVNDRFIRYAYFPDDPTRRMEASIRDIVEDRFKRLWIASFRGLFSLDLQTQRLQHHALPPAIRAPERLCQQMAKQVFWGEEDLMAAMKICADKDTGAPSFLFRANRRRPREMSLYSKLTAISLDAHDRLWVGFFGGGLACLDLCDGKTRIVRRNQIQPHSGQLPSITGLIAQPDGLWLSSEGGGLEQFTFDTNHFETIDQGPDSRFVHVLYEGLDGEIWSGTINGLFRYQPIDGKIEHIRHHPEQPDGLLSDGIMCVFQDVAHNLWVGTGYSGISIGHPRKAFQTYTKKRFGQWKLPGKSVLSSCRDRHGNLWVGFYGAGLAMQSGKTKAWTLWKNYPEQAEVFGDGSVNELYPDPDGNIWIGSSGGGLVRYDQAQKAFQQVLPDPDIPASSSVKDIRSIIQAKDGGLWLAIHGFGLAWFHPAKKLFRTYSPENSHLTNTWISDLALDGRNNLWLGSSGGLLRFDLNQQRMEEYYPLDGRENMFCHPVIRDLFVDQKGDLWIGTKGGLSVYQPESNDFRCYGPEHGLPNTVITTILEDQSGALWLGTGKGLFQWRIGEQSAKHYDATDGLPGNAFTANSACQAPSGELIFGAVNGLVSFFPHHIKDNPYSPILRVEKLEVNGQKWDQKNKPLELSDVCNLKISLNAINHIYPEKVRYRYRLFPYQRQWEGPTAQSLIRYDSLPSGKYRLDVMAANHDGVWTESSLSVPILVYSEDFGRNIALAVMLASLLFLLVFVWWLGKKSARKPLHKVILQTFQERWMSMEGSPEPSFLQDLTHLIVQNIELPELNAAFLARELGVSRTNLYARLKKEADMSVHELIKQVRLEEAARLLCRNPTGISGVAFQVGFKNHSHFSKCFHEKYKMSPREYQTRNRQY